MKKFVAFVLDTLWCSICLGILIVGVPLALGATMLKDIADWLRNDEDKIRWTEVKDLISIFKIFKS